MKAKLVKESLNEAHIARDNSQQLDELFMKYGFDDIDKGMGSYTYVKHIPKKGRLQIELFPQAKSGSEWEGGDMEYDEGKYIVTGYFFPREKFLRSRSPESYIGRDNEEMDFGTGAFRISDDEFLAKIEEYIQEVETKYDELV